MRIRSKSFDEDDNATSSTHMLSLQNNGAADGRKRRTPRARSRSFVAIRPAKQSLPRTTYAQFSDCEEENDCDDTHKGLDSTFQVAQSCHGLFNRSKPYDHEKFDDGDSSDEETFAEDEPAGPLQFPTALDVDSTKPKTIPVQRKSPNDAMRVQGRRKSSEGLTMPKRRSRRRTSGLKATKDRADIHPALGDTDSCKRLTQLCHGPSANSATSKSAYDEELCGEDSSEEEPLADDDGPAVPLQFPIALDASNEIPKTLRAHSDKSSDDAMTKPRRVPARSKSMDGLGLMIPKRPPRRSTSFEKDSKDSGNGSPVSASTHILSLQSNGSSKNDSSKQRRRASLQNASSNDSFEAPARRKSFQQLAQSYHGVTTKSTPYNDEISYNEDSSEDESFAEDDGPAVPLQFPIALDASNGMPRTLPARSKKSDEAMSKARRAPARSKSMDGLEFPMALGASNEMPRTLSARTGSKKSDEAMSKPRRAPAKSKSMDGLGLMIPKRPPRRSTSFEKDSKDSENGSPVSASSHMLSLQSNGSSKNDSSKQRRRTSLQNASSNDSFEAPARRKSFQQLAQSYHGRTDKSTRYNDEISYNEDSSEDESFADNDGPAVPLQFPIALDASNGMPKTPPARGNNKSSDDAMSKPRRTPARSKSMDGLELMMPKRPPRRSTSFEKASKDSENDSPVNASTHMLSLQNNGSSKKESMKLLGGAAARNGAGKNDSSSKRLTRRLSLKNVTAPFHAL